MRSRVGCGLERVQELFIWVGLALFVEVVEAPTLD